MSSDLSGWLHLCGLPCLWGRRVSWGEKNKKAQREIHQKQQHLTNKARTSPSAAAAVKCFCAFVSPFRHCTVMLHPCLLPFFAAAAVVPLPPSLPPLSSPFLPNPLKITFSFRIKFNIWRRKKSPKLLLFSASEQISDGLRHDSGQLRWFVLNRVDFFAAATHYWLLLHPSVLFNLLFFLHLYSLNRSTSNLQCVKFLNKIHSSHTKRLCHLIKTFSSTLPWQNTVE